jgi:hypothetical protein
MGPNSTRAAAARSGTSRRGNNNNNTTRGGPTPRQNDQPRFGRGHNPGLQVPPCSTAQMNDPNSVNPSVDDAQQLLALYEKQMEDIGVSQDKDTERYVPHNYVYNTIWPLKKFIAGEHEMEANGFIATLVLEGVNVDTENDTRADYWKRNRGYVVDCINLKRSNTSGSVKREFVSK